MGKSAQNPGTGETRCEREASTQGEADLDHKRQSDWAPSRDRTKVGNGQWTTKEGNRKKQ